MSIFAPKADQVTDDQVLVVAREATARFTQLAANIINSLQDSLQEHEQLLSTLPPFEEKGTAIDNCKITRLLLNQIVSDLKENAMEFLDATNVRAA